MKRIMILGDSISIGYREIVKKTLNGRAEVVFPEENGRFIAHSEFMIHTWTAQLGKPDIVHWNNGLWDLLMYAPFEKPFTPIDEYIRRLAHMLVVLRSYTQNVIWASTTPVTEYERRKNCFIEQYNAEASKLMEQKGVPVNDLYSLVLPRADEFVLPDHVHLTPAGYDACARAASAMIEKYL